MTDPTRSRRRELEAELREIKRQARPKRPKSPKADRGRVRDNGYLAFLRRQPCCLATGECEGRTEAAHIRTHKPGEPPTGMQRKPDDNRATPLCMFHHWLQHRGNEMAFWSRYGRDPFEVAAKYYAEYLGDGASSRQIGRAHV